MPKSYAVRFAKPLSSVFVFGSLLLAIVIITVVAKGRHWFTPTTHLIVQLPEQGSFGLRNGNDVVVLGTIVGDVYDIRVEGDRMLADLRVRRDFMRFVQSDSTISIRRALGFGDAYIEISRGRSGAALQDGQTLQAVANLPATEMVEEAIEQIRREVVPAVRDLRQVAADLRAPGGNFQQVLTQVSRVTARVDQGDGLAGKLINDPEFAAGFTDAAPKLAVILTQTSSILEDLRQTSKSLPSIAGSTDQQMKRMPELIDRTQASIEQMQAVLKDVRASTAELPAMIKSIHETADAMPGLVLQTQESFRQFQRLVEAAQQNFLVRSYVDSTVEPASGRIGGGAARK